MKIKKKIFIMSLFLISASGSCFGSVSPNGNFRSVLEDCYNECKSLSMGESCHLGCRYGAIFSGEKAFSKCKGDKWCETGVASYYDIKSGGAVSSDK